AIGDEPEKPLQKIRGVLHAIESMSTFVQYDGLASGRQGEVHALLAEQDTPNLRMAVHNDFELNRNLPLLRGFRSRFRRGRRQIGEQLLFDDQAIPLLLGYQDRITRLEDPAIHNIWNRLFGRMAQRSP